MDEERILEQIQEYIDTHDSLPWRERAAKLKAQAESTGNDGGLRELVSWFGGDIDGEI